MTESFLATDAATGAVVLSGETNAGQGGAYVQQILPSPGPRVVLPPLAKDWSIGSSGRIGAPGVFVANADGKSVRLYRYGGGSRTLATGPYFSAALCAGPPGRLWVAWGDPTGLYVTRSSRAAGAFEPVQKLKLPPGTNGLTFLQCEGSAGPIDLFANVTTAPPAVLAHTRSRPPRRARFGGPDEGRRQGDDLGARRRRPRRGGIRDGRRAATEDGQRRDRDARPSAGIVLGTHDRPGLRA